nr:peptidoglycan editing factor PgeF [Paenibacillus albicereus]
MESWVKEKDGLTAGFTGRSGGASGDAWASLNLGLHVGDRDEDVIENRRRLIDALGWPEQSFVCGEQVHGCAVQAVGAADGGRGLTSRATAVPDTDALMTDEPGVLLVSLYADCVPLYFWDPVREAVALAHAGWKGTVLEIAHRMVEAMGERYGSMPADIRAAIGPSIGSCCYEVDEPVLARVRPLLAELAETGVVPLAEAIEMTSPDRGRLDLKELNRQIMIKAGILPTHIECSEWCTGCRTDLFFSHRMEGGATGRMASWIGMKGR